MSSQRDRYRDGLVVGLLAYAAVAVFYAVFDLLAGRGLSFTVNLLGRTIFRGLRDGAVLLLPVEIDPTAIFLYNLFHGLASLAIGVIVVSLVEYAQRVPARARVVLAVIVGGFFITVAFVGWATTPIRPVLPWWSVVVANSLATVVGAVYLVKVRPGIFKLLTKGKGS